MSKNISIKEGNQGRNFTPEKLKTTLQGGGSCLWVPKDGTRLKTISIRKPGTYQAWVEEVYGYSKATVSGLLKESEIKTALKEITENGTYRSEDEGFYGYDVVSVNIPGGGGTAPPSYAPGSSVVGTYPDGDEPVTVSVDDEGNLIKAGFADHILLDTPPDKLTYHDGERITLAGAVVRGYLKNGVPYKNASYQDSILPLYQYIDTGGDEIPGGIVFPTPLRAKYEGGGGGGYISDDLHQDLIAEPLFVGNKAKVVIIRRGSNRTLFSETPNNGAKCVFALSPGSTSKALTVLVNMSENASINDVVGSDDVYGSDITSSSSYTYNNKTVYYRAHIEQFSYEIVSTEGEINEFVKDSIGVSSDYGKIAWIIRYGREDSGDLTQTITLTWPREGDRKHLKTSFEITVTP